MQKRIKELTDKFTVKTDDGKNYIINEFTNYIIASEFQSQDTKVLISKEFRTSKGNPVNLVSDGIYKIVDLDITARKI